MLRPAGPLDSNIDVVGLGSGTVVPASLLVMLAMTGDRDVCKDVGGGGDVKEGSVMAGGAAADAGCEVCTTGGFSDDSWGDWEGGGTAGELGNFVVKIGAFGDIVGGDATSELGDDAEDGEEGNIGRAFVGGGDSVSGG